MIATSLESRFPSPASGTSDSRVIVYLAWPRSFNCDFPARDRYRHQLCTDTMIGYGVNIGRYEKGHMAIIRYGAMS